MPLHFSYLSSIHVATQRSAPAAPKAPVQAKLPSTQQLTASHLCIHVVRSATNLHQLYQSYNAFII